MQGIVSILPDNFFERIKSIWTKLENEFGIRGLRGSAYPHLSWQVAENYDDPQTKRIIQDLSEKNNPLRVKTSNIGIFPGENPIIFLSIVKTDNLLNFHDELWAKTKATVKNPSQTYNPSNWVPHISLAFKDVSKENIGRVIEYLAFQNFDWNFTINNIALICELRKTKGFLKYKYQFSNKETS